jgi:hypothetical protein
LQIIRRLVAPLSVTDEFDNDNLTGQGAAPPDDFGAITRLARLQELLDALWASGVGVLAGSWYNHTWTSLEDEGAGIKLRLPGHDGRRLKLEQILEIRFVPADVKEEVIAVDLDSQFDEIKKELDSFRKGDEKTTEILFHWKK